MNFSDYLASKKVVPNLKFERFSREHYNEYNNWFKNERIKKALYDIEGDWLEFVLTDKTGIEYAVYMEHEMVTVVGFTLPTKDYPTYVVRNTAVSPTKFRHGIGSLVLTESYQLHPLKEGESWIAFVEFEDVLAQRFFEKNGWLKNEAADDMFKYEKNVT